MLYTHTHTSKHTHTFIYIYTVNSITTISVIIIQIILVGIITELIIIMLNKISFFFKFKYILFLFEDIYNLKRKIYDFLKVIMNHKEQLLHIRIPFQQKHISFFKTNISIQDIQLSAI